MYVCCGISRVRFRVFLFYDGVRYGVYALFFDTRNSVRTENDRKNACIYTLKSV